MTIFLSRLPHGAPSLRPTALLVVSAAFLSFLKALTLGRRSQLRLQRRLMQHLYTRPRPLCRLPTVRWAPSSLRKAIRTRIRPRSASHGAATPRLMLLLAVATVGHTHRMLLRRYGALGVVLTHGRNV